MLSSGNAKTCYKVGKSISNIVFNSQRCTAYGGLMAIITVAQSIL